MINFLPYIIMVVTTIFICFVVTKLDISTDEVGIMISTKKKPLSDEENIQNELTKHLNDSDREWLTVNLTLAGVDTASETRYGSPKRVEDPARERTSLASETLGEYSYTGLFSSAYRGRLFPELNCSAHRADCVDEEKVYSGFSSQPIYVIHKLISGQSCKIPLPHNRFKCNCEFCSDYLMRNRGWENAE